MLNVSWLYSIPQFLRPTFLEVNYSVHVFITNKETKKRSSLFPFPAGYYRKNGNIFKEKLFNRFFSLQYDVEKLIFSLKYRQQKLDLNTNKKKNFFLSYNKRQKISSLHRPIVDENSILREGTHLQKDAAFFFIFFQRKFRKCDISTECKHTKTNKNMIFFVLFHKFS